MAVCAKKPILLPAAGLALGDSLFCGQTFSWHVDEAGRFVGAAGTRAARLWQEGDTIFLEVLAGDGEDEAFWRHYLALDEDYGALQRRLCRDERLAACVAAAPGIRVLNQPFFDVLLSFIISQNNNIARIGGIVERLRRGFGPRLCEGVFGLPAPAALAGLGVEDLAVLRAGFRAKYLLDAARRVAEGKVCEAALRHLPNDEARRMLCTIHGVGPKVADCVLLFGLGRKNIAPMDVWMRRAMAHLFCGDMPACATGAEGIAQQYIFHWARSHLKSGG